MASVRDPFAPQPPVDRATLERYLQGGLSPDERHRVELSLESDPLLREAAEGLALPGALQAMPALRAPQTGAGRWTFGLAAAALVVSGTALSIALFQAGKSPAPVHPAAKADVLLPEQLGTTAPTESTLQAVHRELEALPARMPEPRPLPPPEDNFRQPAVERTTVERMASHPVSLERAGEMPAPAVKHGARQSRRLLFLHGLKLVHPAEFNRNPQHLPSPGIPASTGVRSGDSLPGAPVALPYLHLLDEGLGALVHGDLRQALDDFYLVLGQYPDDVNAQFYAGLACYRAGLYPRAARLFDAAAHNAVDSFQEEAEWYGALTLERAEGKQAALPALQRIAREGGFYAGQARQRLGQ